MPYISASGNQAPERQIGNKTVQSPAGTVQTSSGSSVGGVNSGGVSSKSAVDTELEKIKAYESLAKEFKTLSEAYNQLFEKYEQLKDGASQVSNDLSRKVVEIGNTTIKVSVDQESFDCVKQNCDAAVNSVKLGAKSIKSNADDLKKLCEDSGAAIVSSVKSKVKAEIASPVVEAMKEDIVLLKDDYKKSREPINETLDKFKDWVKCWYWKWGAAFIIITALLICSVGGNIYQFTLQQRPYNEGYDAGFSEGIYKGREQANKNSTKELDDARKEGIAEGKEQAKEAKKDERVLFPLFKEFVYDNLPQWDRWLKRKHPEKY